MNKSGESKIHPFIHSTTAYSYTTLTTLAYLYMVELIRVVSSTHFWNQQITHFIPEWINRFEQIGWMNESMTHSLRQWLVATYS